MLAARRACAGGTRKRPKDFDRSIFLGVFGFFLVGCVVDRICFDTIQVCVDVRVCGKVWMYVYINIWYIYMCICIYVGMCIFGPDVMYM